MKIIKWFKSKFARCKHEYIWKAEYLVMYEKCIRCGHVKL